MERLCDVGLHDGGQGLEGGGCVGGWMGVMSDLVR